MPYLGDKPISQVKGKDIQRPYETLTKRENRNTGEGLSSGTVRGVHSMLHKALGAAQQASVIPRNPVEEIKAPKVQLQAQEGADGCAAGSIHGNSPAGFRLV